MGAYGQGSGRVARIRVMVIRSAGWGDLEAAAELLGAQNRALVGVAGVRVEHLRSEWETPGFALGKDNFVAEEAGRVVGYAVVSTSGQLALAAPSDRLADELLERVASRARIRGDRILAVTVASPDSPLHGLAVRHPFELEHETLLMWRPLGAPVEETTVPDRVTIRTFRLEDAEAVHGLLDEAYSAWDPLYVPAAHPDWVSWMTGDPEFSRDVWWLAERDGALAGCALHWSSGWLKDLAVRGSERGRGLGAALVTIGLAEFARRGERRVGLKVDADNSTGAVQLYERLGFVIERREAVWAWSL
jgi:ribosomal protein S18 acetylase RimI-like enzyme